MRCFYINLDAAPHRRQFLEENFARTKKPDWSLTRISAIDSGYVDANEIRGSATPPEKACFLSHKKALQESLSGDDSIFILEDDATFGADTCNVLEQLPEFSKGLEWDIVFTDIIVPHVGDMANLVRLRHELADKKEVRLLTLKELSFGGSTAYIVNSASKRKLYDILDAKTKINTPYDLFLRDKIRQGDINGFFCFPFVTTTSDFSQLSTVQHLAQDQAGLVWDLFRKLAWIERDIEQQRLALAQMYQGLDEEAKAFGVLWAAQAARGFKGK